MKKIAIFCFLIICLVFTSCQFDKNNRTWNGPRGGTEIVLPAYYGNGVYYFGCTGVQFAMSLASFIGDSGKHVSTISGDGTGNQAGKNSGFFVVVDDTK
jgi:hypothetical protein